MRIGVLFRIEELQFVTDLVMRIERRVPSVDVRLICVFGPRKAKSAAIGGWLLDRIDGIENRLVRKVFAGPIFNRSASSEFLRINVIPSVEGRISIDPLGAEALAALSLDILINYCADLFDEKLVSLSREGVWEGRFGNDRSRSTNIGFFEIINGEATTKVALVKLVPDALHECELVQGSVVTKMPRLRAKWMILKALNNYIVMSIAAKIDQRVVRQEKIDKNIGVVKDTDVKNVGIYLARLLYFYIFSKIDGRSGLLSSRWTVGFLPRTWADCPKPIGAAEMIKIINPPNHFLADPFVVAEQGRNVCFVEDYDYAKKRGLIAAYELFSDHSSRLGEALVEPFHLSFPFIFRFGEKLYMVPETSAARQIRVYECADFPLGWHQSRVLMDNVSAADTMLFEHEGRWWMLTNIDRTESDDHCGELFAFHAESPLSAEWTPHPENPICRNSEWARNGGILMDGPNLMRVRQRQGFGQYGKAFTISCVDKLDCEHFNEREVWSSFDVMGNRAEASHHIHSNENYTVFDARWRSALARFVHWGVHQ